MNREKSQLETGLLYVSTQGQILKTDWGIGSTHM